MLDFLRDRHSYLVAKELFFADKITRANAAGMIARDPDFIAECELNGKRPEREARLVVERVWLPELVRSLTRV